MLGKVLKYDFKSCGRILLPFFALAIAMSAALRLALTIAPHIWGPIQNILEAFATMFGVMLICIIVLLTFVVLIVRFYQSLLSNEGYLSFTLPVPTSVHLSARLIVSCCYLLASCVVTFICALIFIPGFASGLMQGLTNEFTLYSGSGAEVMRILDLPFYQWLSFFALMIAFALVTSLSNLLHLYASMAIGSQFGRHRILGSVVAYFGLNFAEGLLMIPVILLPMNSILGENTQQIINSIERMFNDSSATAVFGSILNVFWLILLVIAIPSLILAALHYAISWFFFKKKLNLE